MDGKLLTVVSEVFAMDDKIKAIETVYNGYKFRSRLEARWAVFFDELGVKYEYEPEGFVLDEHGWYLPDFWLVDANWFVEIKPQGPFLLCKKAKALAEKSGCEVLYISGNPYPGEHSVCLYDPEPTNEIGYWHDAEDPIQIGACRRCDTGFGVIGAGYGSLRNCKTGCDDIKIATKYIERLDRAHIAARQARFEHGEGVRV